MTQKEMRTNNIANGKLLERIDQALQECAADIDARTQILAQRVVDVKIKLVPKDTFVEIQWQVSSSLPKDAPVKTIAFVEDGKLVSEVNKGAREKPKLASIDGKKRAAGE